MRRREGKDNGAGEVAHHDPKLWSGVNVEKSSGTMAQRGASELQLVNGGGARVSRTGQRRRLGRVPGGTEGSAALI